MSRATPPTLFITYSLGGGGAERAINIVANLLSNTGAKISLAAINKGSKDRIILSVPTYEFNRNRKGGIISILLTLVRLYAVAWKVKPKIIVLNCSLPELLGSLLLGPWQLVGVEHHPKPWANHERLGKIVRKILKRRKTKWITVSDHFEVWQGVDSPTFIQNPIQSELEKFPQVNTGKTIKRLVFIGRLENVQKQPQWLLSIAAKTNLPVLFIGDGEFRNELTLQSEMLNVSVSFLGYVLDPWKEISSGDLLIIPSSSEGDGLVVVEGISHGCPFILNRVPDLLRFNLPEQFYCRDIDDFVNTVELYKDKLDELVLDESSTQRILIPRNPRTITKNWESFLELL